MRFGGPVRIHPKVTLDNVLTLVLTLHISGHIRPRLFGLPSVHFYAKYTVDWTYLIGFYFQREIEGSDEGDFKVPTRGIPIPIMFGVWLQVTPGLTFHGRASWSAELVAQCGITTGETHTFEVWFYEDRLPQSTYVKKVKDPKLEAFAQFTGIVSTSAWADLGISFLLWGVAGVEVSIEPRLTFDLQAVVQSNVVDVMYYVTQFEMAFGVDVVLKRKGILFDNAIELLRVPLVTIPIFKLPTVDIIRNPDSCALEARETEASVWLPLDANDEHNWRIGFRSITGSTGSSLPLNQLELEELDSDVIYLLRSSRHPAWSLFPVMASHSLGDIDLNCATSTGQVTTVEPEEQTESRPLPSASNQPFTDTRWTRPRRPGGGWGDPHCATFDGLQYECNFLGEALWTRCADFEVHVITKQPSNTSQATVITGFAVREYGEIAYAVLDSEGNESSFDVYLDGEENKLVGENITMEFEDTTTLSLRTLAGNELTATFHSTHIFLQLTPADNCFNLTEGLMGNNNGDPNDDLQPFNASMLPPNSSAERIYEEHVLSWCITELQKSLFPSDAFEPCVKSFWPMFASDLDADACPSACNDDVGCCLDWVAAGEAIAVTSLAEVQSIAEAQSDAVSFTALDPPSLSFPTEVWSIPTEEPVLQLKILAEGSAVLEELNCSICDAEVQCEVFGLGGNQAFMEITAVSLPLGPFDCTVMDSQGFLGIGGSDVMGTGSTTTTTLTATVTTVTATTSETRAGTASSAVTTTSLTSTEFNPKPDLICDFDNNHIVGDDWTKQETNCAGHLLQPGDHCSVTCPDGFVSMGKYQCSKFQGYALVLGFALCLPGDPGADPDAVDAVEAIEAVEVMAHSFYLRLAQPVSDLAAGLRAFLMGFYQMDSHQLLRLQLKTTEVSTVTSTTSPSTYLVSYEVLLTPWSAVRMASLEGFQGRELLQTALKADSEELDVQSLQANVYEQATPMQDQRPLLTQLLWSLRDNDGNESDSSEGTETTTFETTEEPSSNGVVTVQVIFAEALACLAWALSS